MLHLEEDQGNERLFVFVTPQDDNSLGTVVRRVINSLRDEVQICAASCMQASKQPVTATGAVFGINAMSSKYVHVYNILYILYIIVYSIIIFIYMMMSCSM